MTLSEDKLILDSNKATYRNVISKILKARQLRRNKMKELHVIVIGD